MEDNRDQYTPSLDYYNLPQPSRPTSKMNYDDRIPSQEMMFRQQQYKNPIAGVGANPSSDLYPDPNINMYKQLSIGNLEDRQYRYANSPVCAKTSELENFSIGGSNVSANATNNGKFKIEFSAEMLLLIFIFILLVFIAYSVKKTADYVSSALDRLNNK